MTPEEIAIFLALPEYTRNTLTLCDGPGWSIIVHAGRNEVGTWPSHAFAKRTETDPFDWLPASEALILYVTTHYGVTRPTLWHDGTGWRAGGSNQPPGDPCESPRRIPALFITT